MKRSGWTALLALVGLLALALILNPVASQRLEAQGTLWGAEQNAHQARPVATVGSSGEEPPNPPELPWPYSTDPGYVPSQTQAPEEETEINANAYLRVPGSVLRPRTNNVDYTSGSGGGCIYATSGDTGTVWNTPLYLPQGSTVTWLRMFVNDTSDKDCIGWLTVYDLYGKIHQEWGVYSSGTPGEAFFSVDIPDLVIDYVNYSYVLNWRPRDTGNDMQLCGFRIFYTPPPGYHQLLPSIMRNSP